MHDDDNEEAALVEAAVREALGSLLNIAAGVAEMQTTEEGAYEIMSLCDLVAEYYQLERIRAIATTDEQGKTTTVYEKFVGADPYNVDPAANTIEIVDHDAETGTIQGIWLGKLNVRVRGADDL